MSIDITMRASVKTYSGCRAIGLPELISVSYLKIAYSVAGRVMYNHWCSPKKTNSVYEMTRVVVASALNRDTTSDE